MDEYQIIGRYLTHYQDPTIYYDFK